MGPAASQQSAPILPRVAPRCQAAIAVDTLPVPVPASPRYQALMLPVKGVLHCSRPSL